jgi:hypothetical protein
MLLSPTEMLGNVLLASPVCPNKNFWPDAPAVPTERAAAAVPAANRVKSEELKSTPETSIN